MKSESNSTGTIRSKPRTGAILPVLLIVLAFIVSACAGNPAQASTQGGAIQQAQPTDQAPTAGLPATGATQSVTNPPTPADQPTAQAPAVGQPASQTGPKAYVGLFKENSVAVLDTSTNRVIKKIPVPAGPHGIVITPDGRWVYVSSDGDTKVSLIDTSLDQVVNTIEVGQAPHGLAITPDGKMILAAVFGASQVAFIDTASNQVVGRVPVPSPHNIAISPDGHIAYVAAQKQGATGLAIINIDSKSQAGTVPLNKAPRALNFSPDGTQLYFTEAGVDAVQVLDPVTNQITAQIPVGASPHHPIFTPDGGFGLVVSQGTGQLFFLDPNTNIVLTMVTVGKMPHWIAVNSAGTTAWVTNEASNDVSVVDLTTLKVTATIQIGQAPRKIVVQPQPGNTLYLPADKPVFSTSISGMAFADQNITIKAGQTITWVNKDSIAHTVTSDTGLWDSGSINSGKSFSLTLKQPGQYSYHCSIHPFMKGTITVTP